LKNRDANEKKRGKPDFLLTFVQDLLIEQADLLESTYGANAAIPKSVMQVLADQACGGAFCSLISCTLF
jgi:DNA mismatch repair protein MLH3